MPFTLGSTTPPEESDPRIGEIRRRGYPMTKAGYVKAMLISDPEHVGFPLDAEVATLVPSWLPGEMPQGWQDLPRRGSSAPAPTRKLSIVRPVPPTDEEPPAA